MARIAERPMNKQAVNQSNSEFYRNHPEMVDNGKQIPIDPCNPEHAKYQEEWMDSYVKNGGETRIGRYQRQCGRPEVRCP